MSGVGAHTAIGNNKIVCVRSGDRAYGTPSSFGLSLSQYNLNPTYCSWHQISLPNGFYNINNNSNVLSVTVYDASSVAHTFTTTIPTGNYTTSTLVGSFDNTGTVTTKGVLWNALNTNATSSAGAPANFFTLAVNPNSGFFTLSCSTSLWSFKINVLGSLDWILGYRNAGIQTTSDTSDAILDLRSPPCIYIRSSLVAGNYLTAKGSDSVLAVVQNTALYSQTIFQRLPQAEIDTFTVSGQLSMVTFQLADEYGHELPMDSGQDWEISVHLYS
jgi:hypothetical protein